VWLPAVGIGLGGCLALARSRRDPIALAAALAFVGNAYVAATRHQWWIIGRTAFDILFPLALGGAWMVSQRKERRLAAAAAGLLILWNVPFAAVRSAPYKPIRGSIAAEWFDSAKSLF